MEEQLEDAAASTSRRDVLQVIFFLVNFSCATLFFIGSVACIVLPFLGGPETLAFIGGCLFVLPSGLFALGEWLLFYRGWRRLNQPLGAFCLVIAAFALLGVATNVGEVFFDRELKEAVPMSSLLWFAAIGLTIASYLAWCGITRLRVTRRP